MPNFLDRKLGRIKRFGFERDKYGCRYGYVDGEFGERYFLHEKSLECDPYQVYTGCIVTFEIEITRSNDFNQTSNRRLPCAKNVQLFGSAGAIDKDLLDHCLLRRVRYREAFLLNYLSSTPEDAAIKLAIDKTCTLEKIGLHFLVEFCVCSESSLSQRTQDLVTSIKLHILCEVLNDCPLANTPAFQLEIEAVLGSATPTAATFFWKHESVRSELTYQSFLWKFAPRDLKLEVISKVLQESCFCDDSILQEIRTALQSSSPQAISQFWSSSAVIEFAINHRTLLNLAPSNLRLQLFSQLLQNGCDIDSELQSEIQCALQEIQPLAVEQFWSNPNIEARISYRGFLWELAPANLRLKILHQLLQNNAQKDKTLEAEIRAALQDAEQHKKQEFWLYSDVRRSVTYQEFLWNLTPINLRLRLLCQIISTSSADEGSLKTEICFALQNATEQEKQKFWSHSGVQEKIVYQGFLWNLMPTDLRLQLLHQAVTHNLINQYELEKEIYLALGDATLQEKQQFWSSSEVQRKITFRGFLWDLAPREVQEKLTREKYRVFLTALEQFLQAFHIYPYIKEIETESYKVYSSLTPQDYELANLWLKAESMSNPDYAQAKMISARAAEKCVQSFYKSLGHHVRDVAIEQLDSMDSLCYQCDLLIDDSLAVDVKNARQSLNGRRRYVELCVPKFKQISGHEVVIAGVLSPYLKLQEIQASENIKKEPVRFLGEIQKSEIEALEKHFSSQFLSITVPRSSRDNYLPPWLFDYSKRFYCNQHKAIAQLKQSLSNLEPTNIPSLEEMEILSINPIFAYLAAQIEIPSSWLDRLGRWQQSFIRQTTGSNRRITLPFLFLAILSHFVQMLQNEEQEYSPKKYLDLLYCKTDAKNDNRRPLGICDPLEIIQELCETLTLLWNRRGTLHLSDFNRFKFDGKGLLRGQKQNSSRLTTILAYCGGRMPSKVKCGFAPLVLGEHETCQSCQRLVCPKCGHCSEDEGNYCEHYKRRQNQRHPAASRQPYSRSGASIDLSDEVPF